MTAYATLRLDAMQTRRYYDDMAGLYCDMSVSGIGWRALGVEAAADIRLSYRWSLALAASVQHCAYVRDPLVTVLSDVDNTVVDMRAVSRMGGCVPGGVPGATACAELAYFGPKGWGLRLSAGYVGGRYAEPSFLRRTDRIASQGGSSPELFDAFVRQERLDDALWNMQNARVKRARRRQLLLEESLRRRTTAKLKALDNIREALEAYRDRLETARDLTGEALEARMAEVQQLLEQLRDREAVIRARTARRYRQSLRILRGNPSATAKAFSEALESLRKLGDRREDGK